MSDVTTFSVDLYAFTSDGRNAMIPYLNQISPVLGCNVAPALFRLLVESESVYVYDATTKALITEADLPDYDEDFEIGSSRSTLSALLPGNNGCPIYIDKIGDREYFVEYDTIDQKYASRYYAERFAPTPNELGGGGCTAVRIGKYFCRNYDWYYDNKAVFYCYTHASHGKHAVWGMCASVPGLDDADVDQRIYSESYKILPFFLLDGRNDSGLHCEMNILPTDQTINGHVVKTLGTTATVEERASVCAITLPRYILDNFSSVADVVENFAKYTSVYSTYTETLHGEYHLMLADATDTYILEFVPDAVTGKTEPVFIDCSEKAIMTNFYRYGNTYDTDGHIDYTSLTQYGSGLERFNIIVDALDSLDDGETPTLEFCTELMTEQLKYTNAYDDTDYSKAWVSEFVGQTKIGDITYDFSIEDSVINRDAMRPLYDYCVNLYQHRDRNIQNTWQTVHTSIYDIETGDLYVVVQENGIQQHFKCKRGIEM